jgi:hypothetical protein
MTREAVIEGYLINSPKVLAEMLYDTITRYEARIAELEAPKSCVGCEYDDEGSEWCADCSRNSTGDCYTPKDSA